MFKYVVFSAPKSILENKTDSFWPYLSRHLNKKDMTFGLWDLLLYKVIIRWRTGIGNNNNWSLSIKLSSFSTNFSSYF